MVIRIGLGLSSLTRLAHPSSSKHAPFSFPFPSSSFRSFFTSSSHRQPPKPLRRSFLRSTPPPYSSPYPSFRFFSSAHDRLTSLRVSLRRGILAFSRTSRKEAHPRAWQGMGGSGGSRRSSGPSWFWNPNTVVPLLIASNCIITFLWHYAAYSAREYRDSALYTWMLKNLVLTGQSIREGRIWVMLTNAFSHTNITHLFMNGLGLFFITPIILQTMAMLLSPRRVLPAFWTLYLGGALASSLAALLWGRGNPRPTNGASGAIYAMLGYQVMLAPTMQVQLYFFIPMQLRVLMAGVTIWELYDLLYRPNSGMSSEGHLGGLAFGAVAGLMLRRYTGFTPRW